MSFCQHAIALLDVHRIYTHQYFFLPASYTRLLVRPRPVRDLLHPQGVAPVIPVNRYRRYFPQRITEFYRYRVPCLRAPKFRAVRYLSPDRVCRCLCTCHLADFQTLKNIMKVKVFKNLDTYRRLYHFTE